MNLPSVVCKRLVGFRHLVGILALFERAALSVDGIEQLTRKTFFHPALRDSEWLLPKQWRVVYHPVSYTHLDVYKRQRQSIGKSTHRF